MWQNFKNSRFAKIFGNKYLLAGGIFLLWVTFLDGNSLKNWSKVLLNISKQEAQKKYYKAEIKATEEKLLELDSNLDSLEKFAREQYFFKEDDEDIFIVNPK